MSVNVVHSPQSWGSAMVGGRRSGSWGSRLFSVIDVDGVEEQAYLVLLDHPGATLAEIAEFLGAPKPRVRRIVEALEGRGLLTRSPERAPQFLPVPPEVAVEAFNTAELGNLETRGQRSRGV